MNKYYLDTSIWVDYFEDRKDNLKPLGEFAYIFLKTCITKNNIIIYSELVIFELTSIYSYFPNKIFSSFEKIMCNSKISPKQIQEAEKISRERKIPFNDCLHAIIARDTNAMLITRDKHFNSLLDIVESLKPEEVIFE